MLDGIKSYFNRIDEEDRFGLKITGGIHLLILMIAILYRFSLDVDLRPAYIEVTLGEFQAGAVAEYAEVQPEQVATRPDPPVTEPEQPEPDIPDPVEEPRQTEEDPARPVEQPEQTEDFEADAIETPVTEEIDPEVTDTEEAEEQVVSPLMAIAAQQVQEGEQESGDEEGTEGQPDVEQGTGQEEERSAPYDLRWEGELNRSPMIQPMPENTVNVEANIRVRFEVQPDGRVGNIIPQIRTNPELEREVMQTLKGWRFSRLPSGVPQESQWGVITFRFVLE
ncbi:MAG: TonB family protein [Balneolaceae bacterium]